MQDGVEDYRRSFRRGRQRARGHFVEDRAEGEKIGAGVEFLGAGLLGRHVGDRAERGAGAGEMLLVDCVASCVAAAIWLDELARDASLARPKSRILAWPRLVTKIFAGLMSRWTMPSACAASSASAISIARSSSASSLDGAAGDAMLQRYAVQKLHDDEGLAVCVVDFVDGADVGMIQRRGGLRFALESGPGPAGLWQFLRAEISARRSGAASVSSAL